MLPIAFIVLTVCMSVLTGRLFAGDQPATEDELTKIKREYGDALALQGTSKGEILAIARILRAKPDIAIDQTAASGEYCFNSGLGTMIHFATQAGAHAGRRRLRVRPLWVNCRRPRHVADATATGTRPNDARPLVFPAKGTARPASRPRNGQPHDRDCD